MTKENKFYLWLVAGIAAAAAIAWWVSKRGASAPAGAPAGAARTP